MGVGQSRNKGRDYPSTRRARERQRRALMFRLSLILPVGLILVGLILAIVGGWIASAMGIAGMTMFCVGMVSIFFISVCSRAKRIYHFWCGDGKVEEDEEEGDDDGEGDEADEQAVAIEVGTSDTKIGQPKTAEEAAAPLPANDSATSGNAETTS